jgi:gentisate 1,2-dioxygenase
MRMCFQTFEYRPRIRPLIDLAFDHCFEIRDQYWDLIVVMAWRLHEHVLRGRIDNRAPGSVTGEIWLAGIDQPLVLELTGDCAPDVAGCELSFKNPKRYFHDYETARSAATRACGRYHRGAKSASVRRSH